MRLMDFFKVSLRSHVFELAQGVKVNAIYDSIITELHCLGNVICKLIPQLFKSCFWGSVTLVKA